MAKRKLKIGDHVLWNDEMATILEVNGSRAKIKTDNSEKLGYNHITSVNLNELKFVNTNVVFEDADDI